MIQQGRVQPPHVMLRKEECASSMERHANDAASMSSIPMIPFKMEKCVNRNEAKKA